MKYWALIAAGMALCGAAGAQTLSGLKLEPGNVKVGEAVRITGTFDNADNPNCNVRLHFGDGQTQDFKINQLKDVPLVTSHRYAQPGQYRVMLEPKTALPMLGCVGSNKIALVNVSAAPAPAAVVVSPPVAAAPLPAAPAPPQARSTDGAACPQGWSLMPKTVNKKTGAFVCRARIGTALPAARLHCRPPLSYFENTSRGQLGCRP